MTWSVHRNRGPARRRFPDAPSDAWAYAGLVVDAGSQRRSTETALVAQLSSQVPNILAFVLTFWVVGSYWLTHHRHFLLIHRYDGPLLLLNLLFLMTVCFIPWPTAVLGHYGYSFAVWALYALSMAAMGIATTAMWVYASNKPSLVDDVTPDLRRYYAARAAVQPAVFLASIPIAAGLS